MDIAVAGATWLHLAATVVVLGYYAVVPLIVLPALRRSLSPDALGPGLAAIERRALPAIVAALVVFFATGVYLTGSDQRYGGAGAIASPWAGAILVKHGVIVVMVLIGAWVDAAAVRAGSVESTTARAAALRRFSLGGGAISVLGVVVLLLTAVAQAG